MNRLLASLLLTLAVASPARCAPQPQARLLAEAPPSLAGLTAHPVRQVAAESLAQPEGWNAATSAVLAGPAPLWQRGDNGVPILAPQGTLITYADTWATNGAGTRYLARNTALLVHPDGVVEWLAAGTSPGGVAVPAPPGQWWWPHGGLATSRGALVFGNLWTSGGSVYGTDLGPTVSHFMDRAPKPEPIGLDRAIRWGAPYRDGPTVVMAGYDPSTWRHQLALHSYSELAADYASGWVIQTLAIQGGPFGPLALRRHGVGWLASAKILGSAPELNYAETPELAAWTAPTPNGPFIRQANVVDDTRRAGTRSYSAQVTELPLGLVASWSRNVMTGNTGGPDEYGTVYFSGRLP